MDTFAIVEDFPAFNVSTAKHLVSQLGFSDRYITSANGSLNVLQVVSEMRSQISRLLLSIMYD